jgi:hypothetical protein
MLAVAVKKSIPKADGSSDSLDSGTTFSRRRSSIGPDSTLESIFTTIPPSVRDLDVWVHASVIDRRD